MTVGAANNATVTIASNAGNSPFTVPVTGELSVPGVPAAFFQGVLDNALFRAGDPVAPGGIVAVTGEQFTTLAPASTAGGSEMVPLLLAIRDELKQTRELLAQRSPGTTPPVPPPGHV